MPSGGELSRIMDNKNEINSMLQTINGDTLDGSIYWVSTQFSSDYTWHYDVENKQFGFWLSKTHQYSVRPIHNGQEYEELLTNEYKQ